MSDGTPSDNAIGNDSDTVLQHMKDVMVDVVDFGIGEAFFLPEMLMAA